MIEYELRPYQTKAAADVLKHIRMGMADPGELVTTLSAPTGAGKTIISAAAIDELLHGSDTTPGDLGLVILWVSMSPSLNEQTAEKFERASSKLAERTRIIDASEEFDGPSLAPGHVYFLNPQKLGKGARSFRAGNHRRRDLWDTLNGTVERHGNKVLVFVDEAHQGTSEKSKGDATLLAQFLNGTGRGKRKAPVVVGISATPDKFEKSISGRSMKMSATVDIGEVREGGLVKDQILLGHPTEEIAADTTLLMEAARQRIRMARLWSAYTEKNDEPPVEPILLLQLPANVAEHTVSGWLDAIREADPSLKKRNIANALQDHRTETWGQHDVRYVEPPRIQDAPGVKVVVFKDALTTGWDCPRAEVLVSMRGTKDATTITQLIGRTVRTPLAKKAAGDDELNAVRVYLPHFDDSTVTSVIDQLRDGDDAVAADTILSPTRVEPNESVPGEVWDLFEALPTWTRPARTARSTTSRLVKAAAVLHQHGVQDDALTVARKRIVSTLVSHLDANRTWVDDKIEQYTEVDYVTRAIDWMTGEETGTTDSAVAIATSNVLDLYKQAKSRLPDASAAWLWEHFAAEETYDDLAEARLAVAALAQHPDTVQVVEGAARDLLHTWKQQHLAELARIGGQAQQDFLSVFTASTRSEQVPITRPGPTSVADSDVTWPKHLLADERGMFPLDPGNTWERRVLNVETSRDDTIAWYRNPTGGPHALAIPYGEAGSQRMLYPDFLVFTDKGGETTVSIIDPHRPDLGDTLPKWTALAAYAQENAEAIDRTWAVIDDGAEGLLFLDLKSPHAVGALRDAEVAGGGENRIREAFASAGGRFA